MPKPRPAPASWLREFIHERCHHVPGAMMPAGEFVARFLDHLRDREPHGFGTLRILRSLPARFPFGAHNGNRRMIGNLSWTDGEHREPVGRSINNRVTLCAVGGGGLNPVAAFTHSASILLASLSLSRFP